MVYDAWRKNNGPTQHAPNPTAVTQDVLEYGFIFAFALLAFCFALIVPGFRGKSRYYLICRLVISLFIGSAIFLGVLGQEWGSAEIETHTPYKAFTNTEIEAKIGMKIGLGSVNITLKGNPVDQVVGHVGNLTFKEHIDYNERFHWNWRQGRIGFGPYSGKINQEYRAAQFRGSPLPILWIAEYFTLDGELIRWGRSFRTAGWFTNQVLWTAVPTWLIANILSFVVIFYAGWMFLVTGGLMLVSNIIWASIRWGSQPLVIPFEDEALQIHYGPSFWLVMSGGIISCLSGIAIICGDLWKPQVTADFFESDVLQDSDEYYHKEKEDLESSGKHGGHTGGVQRRANRPGTVFSRIRTQRRTARPDRQPLTRRDDNGSKNSSDSGRSHSRFSNEAYDNGGFVVEVPQSPNDLTVEAAPHYENLDEEAPPYKRESSLDSNSTGEDSEVHETTSV